MKVAAITIMKNEADILPFKLKYMEELVDCFLFLDNESIDGSLDIVSKHRKTVYCDTVRGTFNTMMRDKLIEKAQDFIGEDDWIALIDCDEVPLFHVKDLISHIDPQYNCIRVHFPYFFFTREMYDRWREDPEYRREIEQFDIRNFHFFAPTMYSDIRMIRNQKNNGDRPRLTELKRSLPLPESPLVYDNALYVGHFQYRSPRQIRRRLETRRRAVEDGSPSFHYYTEKWGLSDWNFERVMAPQRLLIEHDWSRPFSLEGVRLKRMNRFFYRLFNQRRTLFPEMKRLFMR
jgi:hypothetical protein